MVENGKSIRFLLDIKLLYFSYTDNFLKIQKQGLCPCFFNLSRKMIVFLIFPLQLHSFLKLHTFFYSL